MKKISLAIIALFSYTLSMAQNPVVDNHPSSQLYAIDYQTGQEIQVGGDQAILFKDALIDLVSATPQSRETLRETPGRKIAVIKQIDPRKNINGYQLTWQRIRFDRTEPISTFYYNIDENSLYFFDPARNDWRIIPIEGNNINNLNNCHNYGNFNTRPVAAVPDLSLNGGQQSYPDLASGNNGQDDATAEMQAGLDSLSDEDLQASVAPPPLPQYEQPACPSDGYLWQPGYWTWNIAQRDYFWVPGVWVAPPRYGLLWTPGYWAFTGGFYRFHHGYWGPTVGFYGGINYGYGYIGVGFVGGGWHGNVFRYNTAVVRVNTTVIHNTYIDNTVIRNTTVINRTSFNGGNGGVIARPTAVEVSASRQPHFAPTPLQIAHRQAAISDRSQAATVNAGRPAIVSVPHITATPVVSNNRNFNVQPGNNRNFNAQPNNTPNVQPGNNRSSNPQPNNNPNFQPNNNRSSNPQPNNIPNVQPNNNRSANAQPNNGRPVIIKPANGGNLQNTPGGRVAQPVRASRQQPKQQGNNRKEKDR